MSHDIWKTNYGKSVSGLCRLYTLYFCQLGRDCEAMNLYYDFVRFQTKWALRQDPLEAILVIFGRSVLIFFV